MITETGINLTHKEYKSLLDRLHTALEKNRQYETYVLDLIKPVNKSKPERAGKIEHISQVLEDVI
jgi:hypothetical protein